VLGVTAPLVQRDPKISKSKRNGDTELTINLMLLILQTTKDLQ